MERPNLDYIKEISGGNEEFEKRFLTIIQKEFPKEKNEYMTQIDEDNLEQSATIVHKIKHKLGILGLHEGYRLAIRYEEDLKYGDTKLKDEFQEILTSVEDFISNLA